MSSEYDSMVTCLFQSVIETTDGDAATLTQINTTSGRVYDGNLTTCTESVSFPHNQKQISEFGISNDTATSSIYGAMFF